jgi:uncharacterized protein YodC (DUF2158 family)
MATKFKKGEVVKVNQVIPEGPVKSLHMNSDGEISYLIEWVDANGDAQQRWFAEDDLIAG